MDLDDQVTINNIRDNVETEDERSLDNSLIFTKEFAQKDREFRASISHSYRNDDEIQNISDSLNIRSGNPDLKPEYIQSLEFGHLDYKF